MLFFCATLLLRNAGPISVFKKLIFFYIIVEIILGIFIYILRSFLDHCII